MFSRHTSCEGNISVIKNKNCCDDSKFDCYNFIIFFAICMEIVALART